MSEEVGVRFSFSLERPYLIGVVIIDESTGKMVALPETWTPLNAGQYINGELKLGLTKVNETN